MLDGLHQILRSRRPGQIRLSKPVGMTGKAHQIQDVPRRLEEENTRSKSTAGPFPCGFPKIGISQKSGFRAFLGISGCFYGDFKCPRAPEIHIFCLKSRFLREILKKAGNPNFRENHMGRPQDGKMGKPKAE